MSNIDFRDLKERISDEKLIDILSKYDVKPVVNADKYIIFPTCCHNLTGGSPKLYYYKNSKLFKCYTQCGDSFDIFELIIRMEKLRGKDITIYDAIKKCEVSLNSFYECKEDLKDDIDFLYNILHRSTELVELPHLDKKIMNRFNFDRNVLQIWEHEGISFETMKRYNIKYDPIQNCIIVPNYDIDGNLISIRGRFLDEQAEAKYKPIIYERKILSHPSSLALYGLNITKDAIKKSKSAIIFESEKSVMMMDTYFGEKNNSVAVLGNSISSQQIRLLAQLGTNEVVLAFDRDYFDYKSMDKVRLKYAAIAKSLRIYFNVSYIIDLNCRLLHYKDSPIDRGKDTFEKLLESRIYV